MSSFGDLSLATGLLAALEKSGYTVPTPIQAQTIPLLLAGRDLLGQAQTGTGKTAAFALPLLQRLDPAVRKVQVLVLTPTRELAQQVAAAFERYGVGMPGLRVAAIYGGADYVAQFRQLDRGVQVVVGTPGRVMDHMRRGSLKLDSLQALVLDEADEMLRMGFAEDVEWILEQSPSTRQIALFSATIPEPIRRIAQRHLREPAEVTIAQRAATADTVKQRYVVTEMRDKEAALSRILEVEPIDGVIIFVKRKSSTDPLADYLATHGHRAAALNGDVPQRQRERIVEGLKSGALDIIVATDVAARGLDVQRISHVINYEFPTDSETYVHRIGRTGRAGRNGEAILFCGPRDRGKIKRLERETRQRLEPMDVPSNRLLNKQRVAKFHERIQAALTHPEAEAMVSVIAHFQRDNPATLEQIAAALAVLANGESPLLMPKGENQPTSAEFRGRDDNDRLGDRRDFRSNRPDRDRRPEGSFSERPNREPANREPRENRSEESAGESNRGRNRNGRRRTEEGMETFRLEVGLTHQVTPRNIVGAIANETGLESDFIGRIEIFDDHSLVDLPVGMPREIFQSLKRVWVAGRKLNISRWENAP